MAGESEAFFARLSQLGYEPMLARTTATVRVELADETRTAPWLVTFEGGEVAVTRGRGPADLVILAERSIFDELAAGRRNTMATTLRGELRFQGDPSLMVRFQRLFPAPTEAPIGASDRSAGKRRS